MNIKIIFEIPFLLYKLYWFYKGLCPYCGGEIEYWSARKAICTECGKTFPENKKTKSL